VNDLNFDIGNYLLKGRRMFCLAKPRKHYIMLLIYRTSIFAARYGTIVEPGTPGNWRE